MTSFKRTRIAVAAAMLAAVSLTTVGAAAVSADPGSSVQSMRGTDHWPY